MENNTFGYARVSSRDQNEDQQVVALMEMGVPEQNIYVDNSIYTKQYTTLSILLQAHIYIFFLAIKYHLFDIEDIGYDSSIHTSLTFNEPWESLMQIQDTCHVCQYPNNCYNRI